MFLKKSKKFFFKNSLDVVIIKVALVSPHKYWYYKNFIKSKDDDVIIFKKNINYDNYIDAIIMVDIRTQYNNALTDYGFANNKPKINRTKTILS